MESTGYYEGIWRDNEKLKAVNILKLSTRAKGPLWQLIKRLISCSKRIDTAMEQIQGSQTSKAIEHLAKASLLR